MSDNWRSIRLGEVMTQRRSSVKVKAGSQYPLLGVRWYGGGPFLRETVSSETSKATSLYEVHTGDFIYNRLFAWKGSFGLIGEDLAGCFVSGEFPLFEVDERNLDREFLNFLMCRPIVWEQIEIESTGSTKTSRNRWKEEALTSFRVSLPPLDEQRRIVDLVGSIDTYIDSLETQIETTRTARSALLSELLSNPGDDWQETTLDGLIALTIGGVWGADPGEDEVDVPVYRQTEFDDAGRLHQPAGAIRSITYRQLASRTLEENDVLIQKSAGTPTLPGRVVLVPKLFEASSFSNFLNLIRADRQAVEPVFLFLLLQHLHATKVAFEFQRGTNIRNLDLKSYLATTLLVPPLEEQRRIVDLVGSFDEQISSLESQVESVRALRSGVLSELLSGERLLDESYDVAVRL